jgi:ribosomal protein S13
MFAFTAITGIGRRLANLLCKKADVDLNQRYAMRCKMERGFALNT